MHQCFSFGRLWPFASETGNSLLISFMCLFLCLFRLFSGTRIVPRDLHSVLWRPFHAAHCFFFKMRFYWFWNLAYLTTRVGQRASWLSCRKFCFFKLKKEYLSFQQTKVINPEFPQTLWHVVGFPVNTSDGTSQNGLNTLSGSLQSGASFSSALLPWIL